MTLITYLARVHFADGVLEEALVSELELNKYSKPLLMCLSEHQGTEFSERVHSGLPYHCAPVNYVINPGFSVATAIADIVKTVEREAIDVVVAYGSSQAISIAGECCQILADNRNKRMSSSPFALTKNLASTDFFAIPGIDGLPDLSRPRRKAGLPGALYTGTGLQPSVAIYDPTLTLSACMVQIASAAVNTLSRCVEAYLSENYNPPADGIAYDGILRIVKYMPSTIRKDDLNSRREQMAASLEGTLALQKGSGLAQDLADTLAAVSGLDLNEGALKSLLLPVSFDIMESAGASERAQLIRNALGIPAALSFNEGLKRLLVDLPLPQTFEAHGLTEDHIAQAVDILVQGRMDSVPDADTLESMMTSLHPLSEQVTG